MREEGKVVKRAIWGENLVPLLTVDTSASLIQYRDLQMSHYPICRRISICSQIFIWTICKVIYFLYTNCYSISHHSSMAFEQALPHGGRRNCVVHFLERRNLSVLCWRRLRIMVFSSLLRCYNQFLDHKGKQKSLNFLPTYPAIRTPPASFSPACCYGESSKH